jgi:hypothetical protein
VTQIGRLPAPVTHASAATLGSTVYLIGGRGASTTSQTNAVMAINPLTGRARRVGHLPQPLSDAGAVTVPGGIIVAGGRSPNGPVATISELRFAR